MKFLSFCLFVMFAESQRPAAVLPNSSLTPWRKRSDVRPSDILELVWKSNGFEDFFETRFMECLSRVVRIIEGTVKDDVHEIQLYLGNMNLDFLTACYMYVMRHTGKYCQLAERIMNDYEAAAHDIDVNDAEIRESIGFLDGQDDQLYSMLTAFYDVGVPMRFEWLLEGTFFFLSVDREITFDEVKTKLHSGCRLFAHGQQSATTSNSEHYSDLDERLKRVKQKITDFSKMFRARWRPFLSHFIVKNSVFDDLQNEGLFIYRLFHNEICVIRFKRSSKGERLAIQKISYWNCEQILVSQEHRYNEVGDQVTAQTYSGAADSSLKIRLIRIVSGRDEYSLSTLKIKLKQKLFANNYLNAVQFYNIASEVMLLVCVREGNAVLKGVKHLVGSSCCTGRECAISVDELRRLRSTLSTFKAVFDELVALVLDKKRVNVTENDHKVEFDRRVNTVVTLLDTQSPGIERMRQICDAIPFTVDDLSHLGFNSIKIVFEENYFTKPIINITQLYGFVANRF